MTCFRSIFIVLKKLLPVLLLSFFLFSIIYLKNHWLHNVQFCVKACLLSPLTISWRIWPRICYPSSFIHVFVCFCRVDICVLVLIYVVLSFFTKRRRKYKPKFKMDISALILLILFVYYFLRCHSKIKCCNTKLLYIVE